MSLWIHAFPAGEFVIEAFPTKETMRASFDLIYIISSINTSILHNYILFQQVSMKFVA